MTSALTLGSLTLPGQFGQFTAVASSLHSHEKDEAGLGYSVGYAGDRESLTAYVYTLGIADLPNTIDSEQFSEHMQQCVNAVVSSMQPPDIKIIDQGAVGLPNRSKSFAYVVLQGTSKDQARPVHNVVWLSVVNHNFVKVRCTTRPSNLTSSLVKSVARGLLLHFDPPATVPGGADAFKSPLAQTVRQLVSRESGVPEAGLHPALKIAEDLAIADINLVTLTMALEEKFSIEIPDDVMDSVTTVGDLVTLIESLTSSKSPVQAAAAVTQAPAPPQQKDGLFSRLFGRR